MPARLLLRLHRIGAVAMAYFSIFYVLVNSAVYPLIAGKTRLAQEAFGVEITSLGAQFAWLLPVPIRPDTAAGYLQWRGYGVFAIVFAAWAVMSACGAVRRDEDRGMVETWLATGISRMRLLATRALFFALLSAALVVVAGFSGWLGMSHRGVAGSGCGARGGERSTLGADPRLFRDRTPGCADRAGFPFCGRDCRRRIIVVMFAIDSIGRTSINRSPLTDISVFFLFNRSKSFAPGGTFDPVATVALLVVAVIVAVVAALAFWCRDIGAGLVRLRPRAEVQTRTVARNPLLRVPVVRGLWIRRVGSVLWIIGVAAGAALVVDIINLTATFFQKTPSLAPYLRDLSGNIHTVLLALIWFSIVQGVLAILSHHVRLALGGG